MRSFYTYSAQTFLHMICTWTAFHQQHIHSSLFLWNGSNARHSTVWWTMTSHPTSACSFFQSYYKPLPQSKEAKPLPVCVYRNTDIHIKRALLWIQIVQKSQRPAASRWLYFWKYIYIVRKSFYNKMENARKGNFDQFYHNRFDLQSFIEHYKWD